MALFHVFSEVENKYTGVPMPGVRVAAKFAGSETTAPIYANENGDQFTPPNTCVTDSDGMYSFYIDSGNYDLEFYVGGKLVKEIPNYRPAEVGPSGPANSTYQTTAELENSDTSNVSAILAEVGKAGTFTTRNYIDFTAEVAADTGKVNYIRSVSNPNQVWVRTTILPDGAAQTGAGSGLTVDGELAAKATLSGVARTATDLGAFTGSTIPDGSAIKPALQLLVTAVENTTGNAATKTNATAVGVAPTAADMGSYVSALVTDGQSAKQNIVDLAAAAEARVPSADLASPDPGKGADLVAYKRVSLAGNAAPRTDREKHDDRFDLRDLDGLDLDGNNDNASLVTRAFQESSDSGIPVHSPAGVIVCDSPVVINGGASIQGVPYSPYVGAPDRSPGRGTVFHFTHTGVGFQIGQSDHIQSGVVLDGITTRRDQPAPGPGWSPTDHDYDIHVLNTDVQIPNLMLWNATRGISLDDAAAGRLTVGTVRGQVFKSGIRIDNSYDSFLFDLIDFWTFWSNDPYTRAFTLANLDAVQILKQDGVMGDRLFSIFARSVLRLSSGVAGATVASKINQIYADKYRKNAIWFDSSCVSAEFYVGSLTAQGDDSAFSSASNIPVLIENNSNKLKIPAMESQISGGGVVSINGTGNRVGIAMPTVTNYNQQGPVNPQTGFYCAPGNTLEILGTPFVLGDNKGGALYGGGGDIRAPNYWSPYTPAVAPSNGGAGMTYTIQRAEYQVRGDVVDVEGTLTITAAGAGAGALFFSPPLPVGKGGIGSMRYVVPGVESKAGTAEVGDSGTQITLNNADNTTPIKTNSEIRFSLTYRRA